VVKQFTHAVRDWVITRKQAYKRTFGTESGAKVLKDLAKFCRAHESTFHEDPRVHGVLEGRREVWLRIQTNMQLSDEEMWEYFQVKE